MSQATPTVGNVFGAMLNTVLKSFLMLDRAVNAADNTLATAENLTGVMEYNSRIYATKSKAELDNEYDLLVKSLNAPKSP